MKLRSALLAALFGIALPAMAQISPVTDIVLDLTSKQPLPYNVDARGVIARSGTGLCWRTGYWSVELASKTPVVKGEFPAGCYCEKELMPKGLCDPKPVEAPKAVAVVKPAAEKITLNADALFDFDKAVLRPEGKEAFDALAAKLGDIKLEVIIATGHADRFGTDAYNQKLSERRAAAVKDYLVSKGIDANRIYAEGKGESQPKTAADECKGPKSKKVIACLQPDRRVEVEIIGSKEGKMDVNFDSGKATPK